MTTAAVVVLGATACEPTPPAATLTCEPGRVHDIVLDDLVGNSWFHLTAHAGPFMNHRTVDLPETVSAGTWSVELEVSDPGGEEPDTPNEQILIELAGMRTGYSPDLGPGVTEPTTFDLGVLRTPSAADEIVFEHIGAPTDEVPPTDSIHVERVTLTCLDQAPAPTDRVIDSDGVPIPGATVAWTDSAGRAGSTTTTPDGGLSAVPDSAVNTSVWAPGHVTTTMDGVPNGDVVLATAGNPEDIDGDGLNGDEEALAGTDPSAADSDGDGRDDAMEWRVEAGFSPLPLGVSPTRREILLQVTWADDADNVFTEAHAEEMRSIFAGAPWLNPDGSTGADLIIDDGRHGGGGAVGGESTQACFAGPHAEFADAVIEERRDWFFFQHWNTGWNDGCTLRGYAVGIPSRFSTLRGDLTDAQYEGLFLIGQQRGLIDPTFDDEDFFVFMEAGVAIHELGHNLGLHHGGDHEGANCKPNYPSVMNYSPFGFLTGSFSTGEQAPIDESSVLEGGPMPSYEEMLPNVDWNHDGVISPEPIQVDVNNMYPYLDLVPELEAAIDLFCAPDGIDTDVHTDHDDWSAMRFDTDRLALPSPPPPPVDLTPVDGLEEVTITYPFIGDQGDGTYEVVVSGLSDCHALDSVTAVRSGDTEVLAVKIGLIPGCEVDYEAPFRTGRFIHAAGPGVTAVESFVSASADVFDLTPTSDDLVDRRPAALSDTRFDYGDLNPEFDGFITPTDMLILGDSCSGVAELTRRVVPLSEIYPEFADYGGDGDVIALGAMIGTRPDAAASCSPEIWRLDLTGLAGDGTVGVILDPSPTSAELTT